MECRYSNDDEEYCGSQEIETLRAEISALRLRAETAEKDTRLLRQQLEGEKEAYALSDKIATERMHKAEKDTAEVKAEVIADIIDQARCLSSMIDPIMGDMYCRGWRRALETLEKSITAGLERP